MVGAKESPINPLQKVGNLRQVNLVGGKQAGPKAVFKWLECIRIWMNSNFESTVKEIIGIDEVLFGYEELVEPTDPSERAGMVDTERWKTASKKQHTTVELHKKECSKLYGVLLGQMSEASQIRISEMPSGKRAIEECASLGVLSCVVSTHMNNKRDGEKCRQRIVRHAEYEQ